MHTKKVIKAFREEHEAAALAEGWGLDFDPAPRHDGTPRVELRKRNITRFPLDENAWFHVVAQARLGSARHLAALALVDPVELSIISRRTDWSPPAHKAKS